ncbi:MAG: PP2C family protein-serine/threonine phosphatase [Pseudomonadota bacterium]|jgi:protein phosphatase
MSSYHESGENRREFKRKGQALGGFRAAGLSDTGCERESNEDRFLIETQEEGGGYFVFDGMGGQPAGETAAAIAEDVIREMLLRSEGGDIESLMVRAIESAQEEILQRHEDPTSVGMGTTAVGVIMLGNRLVVGAVGDSRAYHINRSTISQITNDHTLVQQLVDAGQISSHDALVHPQSHVLTRCLGSRVDFSVDIRCYALKRSALKGTPEEWLLLCSDGLYSLVSDEEMRTLVVQLSADDAVSKLVELARSRGGFDNITAVIVPICGRLVAESEESDASGDFGSSPYAPRNFRGPSELESGSAIQDESVLSWRRLGAVIVLSAIVSILSVIGLQFLR